MAKKNTVSKQQAIRENTEINSFNAKLVLFVFGVGPIILISIFLASKGFFD